MDSTLIIIIVVLIAFTAYYLANQLRLLKKSLENKEDKVLIEWLKEMKNSVDNSSQVLDTKLKDQRKSLEDQLSAQRQAMGEQTKMVWERLDEAQKVIRSMKEQIGGIQEFGRDIKDLSNILKSPKLRGGLGEQFLYEVLSNSLPNDLYKTQYKFKDGSICDAVVFTDKGIIPIDSKFPMENFRAMVTAEDQKERDNYKKAFVQNVKKRIDEISTKYILSEEGTGEQALMYIPSETVYYELIVNTAEIEEYAKVKSVIMASPNTLSYFLKVLLVAYQQHELQKHADKILKSLLGIKIEAEKFEDELGILERHISNSYKSMDNVKSKFLRLFTKIDTVQQLDDPTQQKLIE